MSATENIKAMMAYESAARDDAAERIKATNDPVQIAALLAEYGNHSSAVAAFMLALCEIEAEGQIGRAHV